MTAKFIPENVIVADSTVLINFIESGNFSLLLRIFDGNLHITDVVRGEIRRNRHPLDQAINSGKIVVHSIDPSSLPRLLRQYQSFDAGEASCLVLAEEKSWRVATDDGAAKAHVTRRLGPQYVLSTFDILADALRLGLIKKDEAHMIVQAMEDRANFQYSEGQHKEFVRACG